MYAPDIVEARTVQRFELGRYEAVLLTDIVSRGMIRYAHILEVRDDGTPCLYVSSEVNAMASELGGPSHFLCVFKGDRHLNFGPSDRWADLEAFKDKAIEVAREQLE